RARAPDRGARLREGSEGGQEPRGRDGSASDPAGAAGPLKESLRNGLIGRGAGFACAACRCAITIIREFHSWNFSRAISGTSRKFWLSSRGVFWQTGARCTPVEPPTRRGRAESAPTRND